MLLDYATHCWKAPFLVSKAGAIYETEGISVPCVKMSKLGIILFLQDVEAADIFDVRLILTPALHQITPTNLQSDVTDGQNPGLRLEPFTLRHICPNETKQKWDSTKLKSRRFQSGWAENPIFGCQSERGSGQVWKRSSEILPLVSLSDARPVCSSRSRSATQSDGVYS